jgi:hypothetical protein
MSILKKITKDIGKALVLILRKKLFQHNRHLPFLLNQLKLVKTIFCVVIIANNLLNCSTHDADNN